jgi:4-amino-4-deoxy-L-arabinose transferase-like glycosyltransferase
MDFPSWWQSYIINSAGYQVLDPGNPGSLLDRVYLDTGAIGDRIWHDTPWGIHSLYIALQLVGARLVCIGSLCGLFLPQAVLSFLSMIALMIGPVFLPCLMFQAASAFFWGWVWTVASLLASKLAIDIVIGMFSGIMVKLISAIAITGTPNTDIPGFWGAAIVMVLMGFSVRYVPQMVQAIGARVSVGMTEAANQISAGPMRDAMTKAATVMAGGVSRGLLAKGFA